MAKFFRTKHIKLVKIWGLFLQRFGYIVEWVPDKNGLILARAMTKAEYSNYLKRTFG